MKPAATTDDPRPWREGFPPEPWHLIGQLHLGVWLVPASRLPVVDVPGSRALVVGGWGVVGTAWVSYEPGGVLSYDELMVTVLARRGWRLVPSVTSIWVDSPVSRDGGRALWGIPKELAAFDVEAVPGGVGYSAREGSEPLGAVRLRSGRALPVRVPFRFSVLQTLAGRATLSPVSGRTGVALESGSWSLPDHGPLAVLRGRKPLLQLALRDFVMTFGG